MKALIIFLFRCPLAKFTWNVTRVALYLQSCPYSVDVMGSES
uniref:Uncharacterized protein n=1 Tax=Arundo donax TaxID=35708 RepID=A0A0A9AFM5_ARUDO